MPPRGPRLNPIEWGAAPGEDAAAPAAAGARKEQIPPRMLRMIEAIDLQRVKLNAIIGAMVSSGVLDAAEIGSPQAAICPEERRLCGSRTAVVVFGGMAQSLSLPAAEFLRTLTDSDCDVYYYKDFIQCWYQRGLPGLSRDVPSTAEHIRGRLRAQHYDRVVVIGTSAGGFAAILFGVLLGAHRIVALGPQTVITAESFQEFASPDSRIADVDLDSDYVDLARVLELHSYAGEIEIYYGAGHAIDARAAERLARFGCVSLKPVETDQHNVAQRLKREGRLVQALGI